MSSRKNIAQTYGELLPESVAKLINGVSITENDVFLDLGSGKGKVVAQVFKHTNVKEARGIEINPQLHVQALMRMNEFKTQDTQRRIIFENGDFLNAPLIGATIVLIASPCFGPSILHTLGKRINETPTIRTVLTLRPIATLMRLAFKKMIRVECSWDTAICYVYES